MTRIRATAALLSALLACDLNLENPNAPTESEVLNSVDGIIALAVGMQSRFAGGIADFLVPPSLVTDEWGTKTRALISYQSLLTGANFDRSYAVVQAPWADAYQTIKAANAVITHAPQLNLGPGLQAGLLSLAKLYKAMSFGMLVMEYEQVPVDIGVSGPQPRSVVLDTLLALLESARTDYAGVAAADLAVLKSRVLGAGFDLPNTIDAMRARYYLIGGQYQQAIQAANAVSPSVLSVLTYPSPVHNPISDLSLLTGYVAALKTFKDQAEPGDRRTGYWVDTSATPFKGVPDSTLLPLKKYSGANDAYPLYLPDEMKLIKAEAFTRLSQLDSAAFYVNAVRTQTTSPLDEPVASLPALDPATELNTPAQLLAEIAYERRYELFEQGLRWEDTRRLGTAITTTPTLTFLPIPTQECDANPAAGC